MAGRLVSLNWEGMASVRVWGSSQQKASMKLARPDMHKSLPSDVSGSQSARTRLDRKSSTASISHTMTVGETRCQLELFSMKRLSTHQ